MTDQYFQIYNNELEMFVNIYNLFILKNIVRLIKSKLFQFDTFYKNLDYFIRTCLYGKRYPGTKR